MKVLYNNYFINIIDNFIGDIGMSFFYQVMSKLPNLEVVNLNNNGITYEGFQYSSDHGLLNSMIDLNIGNNNLQIDTDKKYSISKPRMRSLKSLQIASVNLNPKGMIIFTSCIQYYTQLYQLSLSNNVIDTNGANLLSRYLMLMTSLYVLGIDNNRIETEGMVSICKNISCLKNLMCLNVNSIYIIIIIFY